MDSLVPSPDPSIEPVRHPRAHLIWTLMNTCLFTLAARALGRITGRAVTPPRSCPIHGRPSQPKDPS